MSKFPIDPADIGYEVVNFFLPIRKVNYIIDFMWHPCAAPWYVYAEMALAAAPEVLLTLAEFGHGDMIRQSMGRPQRRFLRRLFRNGRRYSPARHFPPAKWFWRIDRPVQTGLWWWLIADLSIEFLYQWTTLVNETEWCTGGGVYQAEEPTGSFACSPSYAGFPINNVIQNKNNWAETFTTVKVPAGSYHVILMLQPKYNSIFNLGTDFQARVSIATTFKTEHHETDKIQLKIGEPTEVAIAENFTVTEAGGALISWSWRQIPGPIPLVDHGHATIIVSSNFERYPLIG